MSSDTKTSFNFVSLALRPATVYEFLTGQIPFRVSLGCIRRPATFLAVGPPANKTVFRQCAESLLLSSWLVYPTFPAKLGNAKRGLEVMFIS